MIEFTCEHCGVLARFPDSYAGKHGRCPACGRPVTIPAKTPEDIAELAAALQGESQADGPVPPPPELYEPSLEDLELDAASKDPFSETDIIPVDQILGPETADAKAARRAARKLAAARAKPRASRRVATFTAIAVMLLLIALVYAVLILRSIL
jgi:hypothetical protein